MPKKERRDFQRLRLAKPILGVMRGESALILDIGIAGAYVEHYGTLSPGERVDFTFRWRGHEIRYLCQVVRSSTVRNRGGDGKSPVSHSGIRFTDPMDDSQVHLEDMIATYVGQVLAAQRANAQGVASAAGGNVELVQIGEARRTRARGYLCYRLKEGKWWRIPTESSLQPIDGFTVASYEDEDDLEELCRAYEEADDEGRRLIRLVAELSANSVRR
ncbi:MAG TPA: hypothetical protein VEZ11_06940 [Thermoanaerobaculia bacterium]|nr:hypothetical protein [Thermoanaerobaculia bacterium]